MIKHNHKKGAILYFTIIIMSILMTAVFSITSIVLVQIKNIKEAGDSVLAFYAADTGIEKALYDILNKAEYLNTSYNSEFEILIDGASYKCDVKITQPLLSKPFGDYPSETSIEPAADCDGQYYCIESIGIYRDTRRAIEVKG